jgi:hypothetical protein
MHTQRIDALLAHILVSASKLDDYQERDLGPIHFIKYLYLADLFYAEQHEGETFTGIPWRFHHFGPWDTAVYNHLEKGLAALGAVKKSIPSQYGRDDSSRWSLGSSSPGALMSMLDVEMSFFIDRQVKKFSNCTPELLDFVYKTPPMLRAAPEEYLSFEPSGFSFREPDTFTREQPVERTDRQKKKLREWETQAKARLKVTHCEYTQFFWDKLPLGEHPGSILRFDQIQAVEPDINSLTPTEWMLSEDAQEILHELLLRHLTQIELDPNCQAAAAVDIIRDRPDV